MTNEKNDLYARILNTSYKMFQAKGYDAVKVEDICKKCGITKPTFYRYIKRKDDILTEFYKHVTENFTESALNMIEADNYWEQICIGFESILSRSEEFGPELYSQLFIANLKENKGTFKFDQKLKKVMISLFTKAQKNGQIRNDSDPEALYMSCVYASFGYGVVWCLNNGSFNLLKDFRHAVEIICNVHPDKQ